MGEDAQYESVDWVWMQVNEPNTCKDTTVCEAGLQVFNWKEKLSGGTGSQILLSLLSSLNKLLTNSANIPQTQPRMEVSHTPRSQLSCGSQAYPSLTWSMERLRQIVMHHACRLRRFSAHNPLDVAKINEFWKERQLIKFRMPILADSYQPHSSSQQSSRKSSLVFIVWPKHRRSSCVIHTENKWKSLPVNTNHP